MTIEARLNKLERLAQGSSGGDVNPPDPPVRIYLPVKDGDGRGYEQEAPPSVAEQLAEGRAVILYQPGELPD